jgi:hypothetical protein
VNSRPSNSGSKERTYDEQGSSKGGRRHGSQPALELNASKAETQMEEGLGMHEGEEVRSDGGKRLVLGRLMAYRGKEGCTSPRCTVGWSTTHCYGWHCPRCDAPTSMMGHECSGDVS